MDILNTWIKVVYISAIEANINQDMSSLSILFTKYENLINDDPLFCDR